MVVTNGKVSYRGCEKIPWLRTCGAVCLDSMHGRESLEYTDFSKTQNNNVDVPQKVTAMLEKVREGRLKQDDRHLLSAIYGCWLAVVMTTLASYLYILSPLENSCPNSNYLITMKLLS